MHKRMRQIFVGDVATGGDAPISIQSMTNTKTSDLEATVRQILALEEAGCDIVRFATNSEEDVKVIPEIKKRIHIPTITDIQFNYQLALYVIQYGVDGLRINPGNIGEEREVKEIVDSAEEAGIFTQVGVNSGSIHQKCIEKYHGANVDSLCHSALDEVRILESLGFSDIKVSIKSSDVNQSIEVNRKSASTTDYPLHPGTTKAGNEEQGLIKSSVGTGSLLHDGIGGTIRISLTDDPCREIEAGRVLLRTLGLRKEGVEIISCPACARIGIDLIPLVNETQEASKNYKRPLEITIMDCPANGPGGAREADFSISGGKGKGIIFNKGKIIRTVEEENLLKALFEEIERY